MDALLQGNQHTEQYEAKHESSLLYEGGTLSYDPNIYGGKFQDRYHIKTLQVRAPEPFASVSMHRPPCKLFVPAPAA